MDVDAVLSAKLGQYKSTDVEKDVEPQYDLGNLLTTDLSPLDTEEVRRRREEYLREVARDNTQLLINKIWELPTERTDGLVLAQLPESITILPREKPIPKPKPPSKWELYAKNKGILKKKRPRMVFDEKTQEWKPRWGYKRIDDPKDQWLVEIPEKGDPYEDQFEKMSEQRKERVAKNELHRLRNINRAHKGGIKEALPPPHTKKLSKHQLTQAMGHAKAATASGGIFTTSLAKEPKPKKAKKRKFDPVVGDLSSERTRNLDMLLKLEKKKPMMDVNKAVNMHIADEEKRASRKRKAGDSGGAKRSKSGGKGRGKTTFNPMTRGAGGKGGGSVMKRRGGGGKRDVVKGGGGSTRKAGGKMKGRGTAPGRRKS